MGKSRFPPKKFYIIDCRSVANCPKRRYRKVSGANVAGTAAVCAGVATDPTPVAALNFFTLEKNLKRFFSSSHPQLIEEYLRHKKYNFWFENSKFLDFDIGRIGPRSGFI